MVALGVFLVVLAIVFGAVGIAVKAVAALFWIGVVLLVVGVALYVVYRTPRGPRTPL